MFRYSEEYKSRQIDDYAYFLYTVFIMDAFEIEIWRFFVTVLSISLDLKTFII